MSTSNPVCRLNEICRRFLWHTEKSVDNSVKILSRFLNINLSFCPVTSRIHYRIDFQYEYIALLVVNISFSTSSFFLNLQGSM